MSTSSEFVELKSDTPLTHGRMRLVFRDPRDSTHLIKVIRPDVIDARWGSGAPWFKKRRRYRQYISFIRETEEYIAGCSQGGAALPFAQKILGFVDTDLGLGLVVEGVMDREGNLAPTLSMLIAARSFGPEQQAALERFITSLIESNLIIADINLNNIVYGYDPRHGERFVMIDGLGLSAALPLKAISRSYNRRSKMRRVKRMRARIERGLRRFPVAGADAGPS